MDKKSIIGIVLIFAILVIFSIINQPSKEEIEAAKHKRDSIAQIEAEKQVFLQKQAEQIVENNTVESTDSLSIEKQLQENTNQFGVFGTAAAGTEEFFTIENNLMIVTFSNKGGSIYSVELKNYQTHDSLPLILFDGPKTQFGLNFFCSKQKYSNQPALFYTGYEQ